MDIQILFNIINHTSSLSVAIPLTCCILKIKALNSELRVLFAYIIVSVATEITSFIFIRNNIHTYLVNHLFTISECTFITLIYFYRYETKGIRANIVIFYVLFLALSFVILILKDGYDGPDNVLSTYEATFFIILSGSYVYKIMKEVKITKLKEFYFYWINSAILLYFSMAFFLFLFNIYIAKRGLKTYNNLYTLHWIINVAYNVLLAKGICKVNRK
jgi:hypothetical protein